MHDSSLFLLHTRLHFFFLSFVLTAVEFLFFLSHMFGRMLLQPQNKTTQKQNAIIELNMLLLSLLAPHFF